jgi:replicative DNA helicase
LRTAPSPEEVSRISSSLKVLARELNVSIILLSQLHPSLENRKRKNRQPRPSDLRGTGSLEDDADVILFVYRDTVYCKNCRRRDGTCVHNHEHEAEIIIAKQKNGPIGTVCLAFFAENTSFKDLR